MCWRGIDFRKLGASGYTPLCPVGHLPLKGGDRRGHLYLSFCGQQRQRRHPEIADLLGITETTVRFHIDKARRKLGARNRTQAIARLANLRLL